MLIKVMLQIHAIFNIFVSIVPVLTSSVMCNYHCHTFHRSKIIISDLQHHNLSQRSAVVWCSAMFIVNLTMLVTRKIA